MKIRLPMLLLLLCPGCAGIQFDQPATIEWPSEREPRGEIEVTNLFETVEYGMRSDGVVVWRNTREQNE
jgi:hypothetical protein